MSAFSVEADSTKSATSSDSSKKIIFGRFMLPDMSEYPCQMASINADGVTLLSDHSVEPGTPVIAYLDDIGRVDGTMEKTVDDGFHVAFNLAGRRRERMQRRLEWFETSDPEGRRDDRYVPKDKTSQITLKDGREYPCEVIDISVSGASIKTEVLPSIGTYLSLGRMRGRVVRFTSDGIAIEFTHELEPAKLAEHAML
ncbi:MAG: PilZ domain-containing protein [Anderseniella sp.]